jgi:hypothetical protein
MNTIVKSPWIWPIGLLGVLIGLAYPVLFVYYFLGVIIYAMCN